MARGIGLAAGIEAELDWTPVVGYERLHLEAAEVTPLAGRVPAADFAAQQAAALDAGIVADDGGKRINGVLKCFGCGPRAGNKVLSRSCRRCNCRAKPPLSRTFLPRCCCT